MEGMRHARTITIDAMAPGKSGEGAETVRANLMIRGLTSEALHHAQMELLKVGLEHGVETSRCL
jgi:hypothetical protein